MNFKKQIFLMARQDVKTLVFPEANFSDRTMQAIKIITQKQLAKVILIGEPNSLFGKYSSLESSFLKIVNPADSKLTPEVCEKIYELRKHKGLSKDDAHKLALDPYYFATTLVVLDYADGLVSGSESVASKTFRPALEIIKGAEQNARLSSAIIFMGKNPATKNRPIMLTDPAILLEPTAEELVENVKKCVDLWKTLFFEVPKVAFLSHSTSGSAENKSAQRMQNAAKMFEEACPEVLCEGEIQLDVALNAKSQAKKLPNSKIKGDANILVAGNIDSANCLGKALALAGGLLGVGVLGLGFQKPVGVVSRSASVEEIVLVSAITAIQSQVD